MAKDKSHLNEELLSVAKLGLEDECRRLIELGADVNALGERDYTPLMLAIRQGHLRCAQLLVESGAKLDCSNVHEWTSLSFAILASEEHKSLDYLRLILDAGGTLDVRTPTGRTTLMMASANGSPDCLRLILRASININDIDRRGETALMKAAFAGRMDNLRLLLDEGADLDWKNQNGHSAYDLAVDADEWEIAGYLKALLENRALIKFTSDDSLESHQVSISVRMGL